MSRGDEEELTTIRADEVELPLTAAGGANGSAHDVSRRPARRRIVMEFALSSVNRSLDDAQEVQRRCEDEMDSLRAFLAARSRETATKQAAANQADAEPPAAECVHSVCSVRPMPALAEFC